MPAKDGVYQATVHVAVDLFIMDTVCAFVFIVSTGVLEGLSLKTEILPMIRSDYGTLLCWLMSTGAVLAPLRIYLFRRLAVKWRVLISDLMDLLWTVLACLVVDPVNVRN